MKATTGIILTFLLGAMFVSLFHMSMGMDITGGMADCPFMTHQEVICSMNLTDHMETWKAAFLAVSPTLVLLLAVTGAIAFIVSVVPQLFAPRHKPIPILHRQLRERTYSFSYRPFQELFAKGILHPKLFS